MSKSTKVSLHYELPVPIVLNTDCVGKTIPIFIAGFDGQLKLPGVEWNKENRPYLVKPIMSDNAYKQLKHHMDNQGMWGGITSWNPKAKTFDAITVSSFMIDLQLDATLITYSNYLYGRGHPLSPEINALSDGVDEWFSDLCTWIAIKTGQDLNPSDPYNPNSVVGAGMKVWTEENGQLSLPGSPIKLIGTFDPKLSEKALDLLNLKKIFNLIKTGTQPPESHSIIRNAKDSLHRRQKRRAVIEAGAAVEFVLKEFNRVHTVIASTKTKLTLGDYVGDSSLAHLAQLPPNTKTVLVDLRNDAMHYNPTYDESKVASAVELAELIVNNIEPLT